MPLTPKTSSIATSNPLTSSSPNAATPKSSILASPNSLPENPPLSIPISRPRSPPIPLISPVQALLSAPSRTCLPSKPSARNSTPAPIFSHSASSSTKWPLAACPSKATLQQRSSTPSSTKLLSPPCALTTKLLPTSNTSSTAPSKRTATSATSTLPTCAPNSSA